MLSKARAVKRVGTAITAALLVLLFASVAQADVIPARTLYIDRVVFTNGYIIDLVSYDIGPSESTWVYAITVDVNNLPAHGLSHWVLGLCGDCYELTLPDLGSNYTNPTDPAYGCGTDYTCQAAIYEPEYGTDGSTGACGIKFNQVSDQLSATNVVTHIFTFTITGVHIELGTVPVVIKLGGTEEWGTIAGPVCGSNAVDVACFNASSQVADPVSASASPLIPIVAGAGAALTAGVLWLRRRVR